MQRKSAALPHSSFDIDGDGHVSNKDLFLAKRFDLDKDGKLNEAELAAAKEAINSSYLDQFMFGLERSASASFQHGGQQSSSRRDKKKNVERIRIL